MSGLFRFAFGVLDTSLKHVSLLLFTFLDGSTSAYPLKLQGGNSTQATSSFLLTEHTVMLYSLLLNVNACVSFVVLYIS